MSEHGSKHADAIFNFKWAFIGIIVVSLTTAMFFQFDDTVKEDTWIMKYTPEEVWTGTVVGKTRKEDTRIFEMRITDDDYRELSSVELRTWHKTNVGDVVSMIETKESTVPHKWIIGPHLVSFIMLLAVYNWTCLGVVISAVLMMIVPDGYKLWTLVGGVTVSSIWLLLLRHYEIATAYLKHYSNTRQSKVNKHFVCLGIIENEIFFFSTAYLIKDKVMTKEDAVVYALKEGLTFDE